MSKTKFISLKLKALFFCTLMFAISLDASDEKKIMAIIIGTKIYLKLKMLRESLQKKVLIKNIDRNKIKKITNKLISLESNLGIIKAKKIPGIKIKKIAKIKKTFVSIIRAG